MRNYLGIAGLILVGILCGDAAAAVITFEPPGDVPSELPYEEDGYSVTEISPSGTIATDGSTNRWLRLATTTDSTPDVLLTSTVSFDLISIDVRALSSSPSGVFRAESSSGAIRDFLATDTTIDFSSVSGWSNIDYVNFFFFKPSGGEGVPEGLTLDLDNITVAAATTADVPEPASLIVWSLGALGCAIAARRRKRTVSSVVAEKRA